MNKSNYKLQYPSDWGDLPEWEPDLVRALHETNEPDDDPEVVAALTALIYETEHSTNSLKLPLPYDGPEMREIYNVGMVYAVQYFTQLVSDQAWTLALTENEQIRTVLSHEENTALAQKRFAEGYLDCAFQIMLRMPSPTHDPVPDAVLDWIADHLDEAVKNRIIERNSRETC